MFRMVFVMYNGRRMVEMGILGMIDGWLLREVK